MRKLGAKGIARLSDAAQRALSTTRGTGAAVALLDGEEMFTCVSCGQSVPPAGARSPVSGFTGLAVQQRETLVCDDTQADSRVDADVCKALNVRSMAVAPIKVNGAVEGVFAVFFDSPRAVSRMHVAMLRTLADAAAAVLEREPLPEPSFVATKNSSPIASSEALSAPSFPVLAGPGDLPAALHEITDDEIAEVVEQLRSKPDAVAPAPARPSIPAAYPGKTAAEQPATAAAPLVRTTAPAPPATAPKPAEKSKSSSEPDGTSRAKVILSPPTPVTTQQAAILAPKREAMEVLPAAADPLSKPFPRTTAGVTGASAQVKEPAPVPSKTEPVALNVVPQAPMFQAFAKESLRRQDTRRRWGRMLVPAAGIAALVIAVLGFALYRSPGVKATPLTDPPEAVEAVVPAAQITPSEQALAAIDTPAARPPIRATEKPKRADVPPTAPQVVETVQAKPAMVVRSSIQENRDSVESEPVEAPALNFAPVGSAVALPSPSAGTPVAPRAAVLEQAKIVQKTRVRYPPMALANHVQGAVVLQLKIGKDGRVIQATRIKGDPLLGQAAIEAVRSWRYKPAMRDGVPMESETEVTVNFQI